MPVCSTGAVEISLSHTQEVIDGCTVHNVDNGALCACFDERVPLSVIDYMAKQQPLRAVFPRQLVRRRRQQDQRHGDIQKPLPGYEGEGDLMKLQFKHQPFQAEAADAVCDVFCGQPYRTVTYRRDLGDLTGVQMSTYDTEVGFRNQPLVPELTNRKLLDNLRAVQRRNGLKPSDELTGPGVNLSIEMETGTGKTYTYVKNNVRAEQALRLGASSSSSCRPVAIREGVYKSLQTTQEHFAGRIQQEDPLLYLQFRPPGRR